MATDYRLPHGMRPKERMQWYLGWHPRACVILALGLSASGWVLAGHPLGLTLGLVGLWLYWDAGRFVRNRSGQYKQQAEAFVRSESVKRLNINSHEGRCYILSRSSGSSPFGIKAPPVVHLSAAILCDTFIAINPEARFRFTDLTVQLPEGGEEIYYRYISGVEYKPPVLEIHLSNKQTKRFTFVGDQSPILLGDLRARLRGITSFAEAKSSQSIPATRTDPHRQPSVEEPQPPLAGTTVESVSANIPPTATQDDPHVNEPRHCYLRLSRLQQLYQGMLVLDTLLESLQVPGKSAILKQLTAQEKREAIEAQIDHFRRSPTSVWYNVPKLEVLAASIWRAGADGDYALTRKMVREHFCAVSSEDDLRHPVAKWLASRGYEPYMEVPLGRRRVDLVGVARSGSGCLLAVELKNDDAQFARAIDQLGTFAEYAHFVYVACTPAFAADHLDRNTESRGVKHWDAEVMNRKLAAGGYGLLIVERDTVFEVIKPIERTPSRDKVAHVVRPLSSVMRVEC